MRARAFIRPARKLQGTPMRVIYRSRFRGRAATIPASLALARVVEFVCVYARNNGNARQLEASFASNLYALRTRIGIPVRNSVSEFQTRENDICSCDPKDAMIDARYARLFHRKLYSVYKFLAYDYILPRTRETTRRRHDRSRSRYTPKEESR